MKKVVLASLLAVAAAMPVSLAFAQQPAAGQVQMSDDEYKLYNAAATATTPAAKVAGFQAYLKAYPNSAVKADVLVKILEAEAGTGDKAGILSAADQVLAVDPNNLEALTYETLLRRQDADALTDPTAKAAALDVVAGYAQKGLAAPKPAGVSDADFQAIRARAVPLLQSAVADDDLAKKDNAGAIAALKQEIDAAPDQTKTPSQVLQDVYTLANAYYTSTPPDYLNCTWYATRAAAFAPDQYKAIIQPVANYCYKKFHGSLDGYPAVQTAVQTNLDPPAGFLDTIKPAPKPEDYVKQLIASTPDLATLAISDREFALQYGTQADADKVFDSVKGKSVELPDVLVIAATADAVQVAVSDDAVQGKVADFTFTMKEPLKTVPDVGSKVTLNGTYASYTQKPLMITMSDSFVVEKKAPAKAPVRRRPTH